MSTPLKPACQENELVAALKDASVSSKLKSAIRWALAMIDDTEMVQRNIGCDIAAKKLMEIAETGEHAGTFGGLRMELAAQAIVDLHVRIAKLRSKLKKLKALWHI